MSQDPRTLDLGRLVIRTRQPPSPHEMDATSHLPSPTLLPVFLYLSFFKSLADKHTQNNLNSACYYDHNLQINLIFHGEILSYGSWVKVMGKIIDIDYRLMELRAIFSQTSIQLGVFLQLEDSTSLCLHLPDLETTSVFSACVE